MNTPSDIQEKRLRRYLRDHSHDLLAKFRLAIILEEHGSLGEALSLLNELIAADPNFSSAFSRKLFIEHLHDGLPRIFEYGSPAGADFLGGPFLLDEERWIVLQKSEEIVLLPVALRFGSFKDSLNETSVQKTAAELKKKGYRLCGNLELKKKEVTDEPPGLQVELGKAFAGLFSEIVHRADELRDRCLNEMAVRLASPVFRISDEMPAERYRILRGDRLLAQGGMKSNHLFLIADEPSAVHNIEGIEALDENLGIRGLWIHETCRDAAIEENYVLMDTATLLMENVYMAMSRNIALLWNSDLTRDLIKYVRKKHPLIPWKSIEQNIPQTVIDELVVLYVKFGGSIARAQMLFDNLAEACEKIGDPQLLLRHLDDLLHADIQAELKDGVALAIYLSGALNERLLYFLSPGHGPSAELLLSGLPEVSRYVLEVAKSHLEQGKIPALVCLPELRPLIRQCLPMPELRIISALDIPPDAPVGALHDVPQEIHEKWLSAQEGVDKLLARSSVQFLFIDREELIIEGNWSLEFAALTREGKRSFLCLPGVHQKTCDIPRTTVHLFQEQGYFFEGIYNLTFHESQELGTTQDTSDFLELPLIDVALSADLLETVNSEELKRELSRVREGLEKKYGLRLPEVSLRDNGWEAQDSCITTIASKRHSFSISREPGGGDDRKETLVAERLRELIEERLADLVSFETASHFIQRAKTAEPGQAAEKAHGRNTEPDLARYTKAVLRALVTEKIPCRNADLIMKAVRENWERTSPEDLAEDLRQNLRVEILEEHLEVDGRLRAVILSDEMEIILTTSFFLGSESSMPEDAQEWNYVAEVLANEYMASKRGKCMLCSRALRRAVHGLLKEKMPMVAIIAREEVPGGILTIEGEIGAPEGFRKFIVDEFLKLGIMTDYEDWEEKARGSLKACLSREKNRERDKKPPAGGKKKSFVTVELGRNAARLLDDELEGHEFAGFVLFLRQWLSQSLKREIPDVKVMKNDDSDAWSMVLRFPGHDSAISLPPQESMEIWPCTEKEEKGAIRLLGALEGKGRKKNAAARKREKSAVMPLSRLILLHLFTGMMNLTRSFPVDDHLKSRIVERAITRGFERPSFTAFIDEALREGSHPLEIEEALPYMEREITFLGREAGIDRLRRALADREAAILYGPEKVLTAVGLHPGIESFFLSYLKEVDASILLASFPSSVESLKRLLGSELFRLMEQGFPPLVFTERLDDRFIGRLITGLVPQARVISRKLLPSGAKVRIFSTAGDGEKSLFSSPLPADRKCPLIYLSHRDFYLFCALLCDYEGNPEKALGYYERMRYLSPWHPTALWRGAFCHQRMGNAKKARDLRRKARLHQKSICLCEPGYYQPDDNSIEGEQEIQRLREERGSPAKSLLFRRGYCEFQDGDLEKAQKMLNEALKDEKNDDELYMTAAHILRERESYHEALPLYMKALRLNPYNIEVLQGIASALAEESDYKGALNLSRKLVRFDALNKDFIHNLGMASQELDDYGTMLTCAEALLAGDRENSVALYMRSRAFHHLGMYDREIVDLRELLKLKPASTLYNRTLGNALWTLGLFDEGLHYYEQALLSPDESDTSAFHRVKIMTGLGDYETAPKILERALREKPGSSMLHHLHGEILLALGNLREAHDAFKNAGHINASNLFYQLSLNETLLLQGARAEAEDSLNAILKKNPAWVTASLRCAALYAEKELFEESRKILRKAMEWAPGFLELYVAYFTLPLEGDDLSYWHRLIEERAFFAPHNHSFHFIRGLLFGLAGDYIKASLELEKAYLLAPEATPVVEYLCRMLMASGDAERPLVILRVAMKKILRSSRLFYLEAMCWHSIGNTIRARESLKKASMHQPLYPYACTARGHLFHMEGCEDSAAAEINKALRYDGRFSPALLLQASLKNPKDAAMAKKARAINPLEVLGFR
jgi:flagellar biosynthesis component FlhA/Tfp pilus assembly protein PilF